MNFTVTSGVSDNPDSIQLAPEVWPQAPIPAPGVLWIPLRNRRGEVIAYTLIDDEYAHLAELRWHLSSGYAHRFEWRQGRRANVFLHHAVLGERRDFECDHVNRNRLDNRRSNLRWATRSENARNAKSKTATKYKGVQLADSAGRWSASVTFDGTQYPLGSFATPEQAAFAYDFAAIALHGEFAATNFRLSDATRHRAAELRRFLLAHHSRMVLCQSA